MSAPMVEPKLMVLGPSEDRALRILRGALEWQKLCEKGPYFSYAELFARRNLVATHMR
jgi:hypothetical protein